MSYHLWVIGCQYNEWDGARLRYFLDSLGLDESDAKEADAIIIVACAVRQTAVDRILGRVKNWQTKLKNGRTKEPKNNKLILATGCVLDADKKKFAGKDIKIFEPGDFKTLEKYLGIKTKKSRCFDRDPDISKSSGLKSCSYVPIMTGCNNFCSYCAVPYTRGREQSRPIHGIIDDVKKLIATGQKEIMLLGQNVNSYTINDRSVIPDLIGDPLIVDSRFRGNDNSKLSDFTILLNTLNNLEGDFEISFTSNHPKDMTDDIISAVATLPKVKKEIHLPLQSGSDKVLQSMNRPYTIKQYLGIVKKIKQVRNTNITTDVIVGYPTEAEDDFEKTVEIFKKVKFKQAYINKYSPRVGTAAYKLGDPISWSEKQRRWRVLNDLIKR